MSVFEFLLALYAIVAGLGHVVSWFALWQYSAQQPWTVLQGLLLAA